MGNRKITLSMTLAAVAVAVLLVAAPTAAQDPSASEFDVPSDADIHYIDLGDGGDNPFKPGCHWHYGNDSCSAPEFFFMGDRCSPDGRLLFEWTNDRCHEPEDDIREYSCEKQCQKNHGTSGSCVVVENHCRSRRVKEPDATRDSAKCVCESGEESG